jgi:glycosyltransferase involved in cell wall biosynthesis
MRVMIDAMPLLVRSAGVKAYLYHWLHALRRAGGDRILTFPPLSGMGPLNHENSIAGRWVTTGSLFLLHAANQSRLPILEVLSQRADIFHSTILTRRRPLRLRSTATVHDLTCWKTPELHTPANVAADREFGENILKRADGLIAVSEHTRQDAIEVLGIDPERITTIHSGVPEAYFAASHSDAEGVKNRLELHKPYVLVVGTIEPRKNMDRMLDAWQSLPEAYRHTWELVIAGPLGWASEAVAARLKTCQGVRWLGYVDEPDLPALTRGATLLAYPSLYEGFGFPAAQAMAAGVPVLTSNVSALPEVAGPGAVLVDPKSVEQIRSGLRLLLDSPDLCLSLGRNGQSAAQRYRWGPCAEQSLRFFERVIGS